MRRTSPYRWITADKIHDGKKFLTHPSYIKISATGQILELTASIPGSEDIEYFEGIICPGFINAHCHLELSHMTGRIEKHTGLTEFLLRVMSMNRDPAPEDLIEKIIADARAKGTIAYGDISNTPATCPVKDRSDLHFHTFVEVLGRDSSKARKNFEYYSTVLDAFRETKNKHHRSSLTLHAPYSVSDELCQLVCTHENQSLISIHSQESASETELFRHGTGAFIDFYKKAGLPTVWSEHQYDSSLQWIFGKVPDEHALLLVHNTDSRPDDWKAIAARPGTHVCLCPNANLYIENRLPDISGIADQLTEICLGTDSLASNDDIDIFSEILTILKHFPEIALEDLLRWATYNGARALGWTDLGEISAGTSPHLVNISKDLKTSSLIV